MYSVEASTTISSDAHAIWKILMETEDWSKWNTFVTSIKVHLPHRQLHEGSTQTIQICPIPSIPGHTETYTNVVTKLQENKELVWEGVLLSGVIFKTEHWCRVEAQTIGLGGEGIVSQTKFIQGEKFTGLLSPMVWLSGKLGMLQQGYERMNEDLKNYAER